MLATLKIGFFVNRRQNRFSIHQTIEIDFIMWHKIKIRDFLHKRNANEDENLYKREEKKRIVSFGSKMKTKGFHTMCKIDRISRKNYEIFWFAYFVQWISHEKSPNTFNTKTNLCLYLYICLALYLAVIRQSEKEFYGWFFILILMADNNDLCCMYKINFHWQDAFEIDNKR